MASSQQGLCFSSFHTLWLAAFLSGVRATMVFGAGVNYRLTDHLGVRAEYRGLSYKNPDFKDPGLAKLFTVTSEPVVSIVYRFGKSRTKEPLERTLRL